MGSKGSRKPGMKPESEKLLNVLSSQELLDAADTCKVLWAKVKGHPYWPAQVMSNKAAEQMMKGINHSKEHTAPVQFFGTLEIAWMREIDTVSWEKGMGSGLFHKGKSKRHFLTSLEQVQTFLLRRKAPTGWWGKPPDKRVLPLVGLSTVTTRRTTHMLEGSISKSKANEAKLKPSTGSSSKRSEPETPRSSSTRDRQKGTELEGRRSTRRQSSEPSTPRAASQPETPGRQTRTAQRGIVKPSRELRIRQRPPPPSRASGGSRGPKRKRSAQKRPIKDYSTEEEESSEEEEEEEEDVEADEEDNEAEEEDEEEETAADEDKEEIVGSRRSTRSGRETKRAKLEPSRANDRVDEGSSRSSRQRAKEREVSRQSSSLSPKAAKDLGREDFSGRRMRSTRGSEVATANGINNQEDASSAPSRRTRATLEETNRDQKEEQHSAGAETVTRSNGQVKDEAEDSPANVRDEATEMAGGPERTSRNGRIIKVPRKMGADGKDLAAPIESRSSLDMERPSANRAPVHSSASDQAAPVRNAVQEGATSPGKAASAPAVVGKRRRIIQTPGIPASLLRQHLLQRAGGEHRVTPFANGGQIDSKASRPSGNVQEGNEEQIRSTGSSGLNALEPAECIDEAMGSVPAEKKKKTLKQILKELPADVHIDPAELEEGSAVLDVLPKYEAIKRNIYLSRERPKRLPKSKIQVCSCKPHRDAKGTGLIGCEAECLNSAMLLTCDTRLCPCGFYCANKPFYLRQLPKLQVFHTGTRGWGVRSVESLKRGDFICEYVGEVIDWPECAKRMAWAKADGATHAAFYIMELQPGLLIDARKKGNIARMLNSSCGPNAETIKWHDAATGEAHIVIQAKRDILPGEEVTYDYQFEHYGLGDMVSEYKCLCGAPNCRGTMDRQPERCKDFGKRIEVYWEANGVYYRGTVRSYNPRTGKHVILYDDNEEERVNLKEVPHRWIDISAPMQPLPPELDGQPVVPRVPKTDGEDADAHKPLKMRKAEWGPEAEEHPQVASKDLGASSGATSAHGKLGYKLLKCKNSAQSKPDVPTGQEKANLSRQRSADVEQDAAQSLVSMFSTSPSQPAPGGAGQQQPSATIPTERLRASPKSIIPAQHHPNTAHATAAPRDPSIPSSQGGSSAPPTAASANLKDEPTEVARQSPQQDQPAAVTEVKGSSPLQVVAATVSAPQGIPLQHLAAGVAGPMPAMQAAPPGWPQASAAAAAAAAATGAPPQGAQPVPALCPGGNLAPPGIPPAFPGLQAMHPVAAAAHAQAQAQAALQQQLLQQQIHAQVAALQAAGVPANQISAALQVGLFQAGAVSGRPPAVIVPQGAMVLSAHPSGPPGAPQQVAQAPGAVAAATAISSAAATQHALPAATTVHAVQQHQHVSTGSPSAIQSSSAKTETKTNPEKSSSSPQKASGTSASAAEQAKGRFAAGSALHLNLSRTAAGTPTTDARISPQGAGVPSPGNIHRPVDKRSVVETSATSAAPAAEARISPKASAGPSPGSRRPAIDTRSIVETLAAAVRSPDPHVAVLAAAARTGSGKVSSGSPLHPDHRHHASGSPSAVPLSSPKAFPAPTDDSASTGISPTARKASIEARANPKSIATSPEAKSSPKPNQPTPAERNISPRANPSALAPPPSSSPRSHPAVGPQPAPVVVKPLASLQADEPPLGNP